MTDEDPPPLKSAGETPAELVRALRALGEGDRDSARLARVAERLGARVAADAAGGTAASLLQRLTGTKTALAGLVLGVVVLGALGYALLADRREHASAPVPAPSPAVELPAAPTPVAAPATQVPMPAPPSEPAQSRSPRPVPARGGERPRVARSSERSRAATPSAPAQRPAPAVASAPAAAVASGSASAAEPSGAEAEVEPVPATTSPAKVQPQARSESTAEAPVAQPSELTLLQRARKAAAKQPEAALRVLREHAERFPNGLLAPEREVLTIEVLRRLDRSAEAAQRLEQFKLRHPRSIYLRRLEHEPSAADEP